MYKENYIKRRSMSVSRRLTWNIISGLRVTGTELLLLIYIDNTLQTNSKRMTVSVVCDVKSRTKDL